MLDDDDCRTICWTITMMLLIWTAAVLMIAHDEFTSDRQQQIPAASPIARPGEFVA